LNKANEFGDVLINEIMFDVGQTGYEYIEIYNTTTDTLSIDGWYFADESDVLRNRFNRIITTLLLPPSGYAIIANDSLAYYSTEPDMKGVCIDD